MSLGKKAVKAGFNMLSTKVKLIIILGIVVGGLIIVTAIGVIQSIVADDENNGTDGNFVDLPAGESALNEMVEGYRHDVEFYAKKFNVSAHVDVLLALMMQETGGVGNDPFQASESKCGAIGCITNPQESIQQGVKYYSSVLKRAGGDIKLALQSYNFGGAFIDYVKDHGGKYTKDLAIKFSKKQFEALKYTGLYSCVNPDMAAVGACYGDVHYVDKVLKYYHPKSADAIKGIDVGGLPDGSPEQVKKILSEMKKYDGTPYVFGGANPSTGFDCSGLMQWAYNKVGIKLPRTANEQYNKSKKISKSDLKPGDLVFFSGTYNAGVPVTHVGIYIGNNKMYNSNGSGVGTTDLSNSYWSQHLYGYGRVANF